MPRDESRSNGNGVGGGGGGVLGWWRVWWRALVAELVATALLIALGIAAILPFKNVELVHPAMAFGCVVTGNCVAFGATSGAHMNPAVTLAALMQGRLGLAAAAGYVVAQLAGALAGFGALLAVAPASALAEAGAGAGCTQLAAGVAPAAGAALEAALTGALVLAVCGLWAAHDDRSPDHAAPVKLGLLVAGLVFAGGNATGASLNPARSLAPALLRGHWRDHWVYWAGPLAGAALAQLLHRWVLAPPRARPAPPRAPPSAEELPLADKP